MSLKLRPFSVRVFPPSTAAVGMSAASTRCAAVPIIALVLVVRAPWPDDAFGSCGKEAKAQFQKTWDAWKAWAKMEELE